MSKCKICDKDCKNFNGVVYLSDSMEETYLCRSHYMKYCKSIDRKKCKDKYKDAKPGTKEWYKFCDEEAKIYLQWEKNEITKFRSGRR